MIIWGAKSIERTVEQGWFHCFTCHQEAPYRLQQMRRWFTLYFIPVLPYRDDGQWVACDDCGDTFHTKVLRFTEEDLDAYYSPWNCPHCSSENEFDARRCGQCGRDPNSTPGKPEAPVSRRSGGSGRRRRRRR